MSKSGQQDIVQQLVDNTTDIIAASSGGGPEKLAALAHRQRTLTQALKENAPHIATGISRTSINALQNLVAKAIDAVRIEMGQNRGSMQAAGIKKKVLNAYGNVTISSTPPR